MLRLHDTLSGDKKPFAPQEPGKAKVYVCGPTVYDYAHLGHIRCYVVYDVLVRHLRRSGLEVKYVRNVTDIDDKILKRAAENGETPRELAERFTALFHEDMARVGNLPPDVEPKVSEHLPQIFAMIQQLIDKGHAYEVDGDVYFGVESFPTYGKLSHRDLAQMKAGASERLDAEQSAKKKHAADFALWKSASDGEGWDSPWGRGRPGWHIECSAMSTAHLGDTLDLHGGGLDLVFPHHENEIAQSEAATGHAFCDHWVHNGFVEVDKTKMSKSLGNFFTARDLFERVEAEAVRYFTMTVHYRAPLALDWTLDDAGNVTGFPQFEEAERRVAYVYGTKQRLASIPEARIVPREEKPAPEIGGFDKAMHAALDDDLNMPVALAAVSEMLKAVNELCDVAATKKGQVARSSVEAAQKALAVLDARLGLGGQDAGAVLLRIRDRRAAKAGVDSAHVEAQIQARVDARAAKDFAKADAIRAELTAKGVELHDGPSGTTWTMAG
ncbi:MAG: cysteine--tRNA ligase [Sandaracinus sp.]|nr:cysteine--tRNA ligase [Sandaracinus sp.]MCB9618865.1 cysteine--tRNA ligase [Sandaracinus sp.]